MTSSSPNQAQAEDAGFVEAMAGFDALLRGQFRRTPDERRPTPLATAARLLVEALHQKPVMVAQAEDETPAAYLERFAAANRLRLRRVQLQAERPNGETGLIAFRTDGTPVVIIPALFGRAWCLDGAQRRRLEAATWTTLDPEMFTFHPLLPDGSLHYRQILLFGLRFGKADLALIAACGVLASMLALLPLAAATQIARIGVHSRDLPFLAEIIAVLVCALAAETVIVTMSQLVQLRFHGRSALVLTAALLDRMIRLPPTFLRGTSQAIVATQMESVTRLRASALTIGFMVLIALVNGLAAGILIATRDPMAGLVTVGAVLGLVAAAVLIGWVQFRAIYEGERMDVVVLAFAYDLIRLVPVLRAMQSETRAFRQWALNFLAFQSRIMRSTRYSNMFRSIEAGWDIAATAIAFLAVALAGAIGTMDAPSAIAFVLILTRLLSAGRELARGVLSAAKLLPMAKLSLSFVHCTIDPPRPATGPVLHSGRIDVDSVSFSYGGRQVLRDVSFAIQDGEFVGIMGPSGSGKSTLLRLLLGLDQPSAGQIAFDGYDLQQLDRRRLLRHVGASLQNGQVHTGSIFENIQASTQIDMSQAWHFAGLAGMAEELSAMPMGLRTLVGEAGDGLSRGQLQRLLLARALAQEPKILILDEAMTALDTQAQHTILQMLADLSITRVVVTHQSELLARADRIIMLRNGQVEQIGSPAQTLGQSLGRPGLIAS